MSNEPVIPPTTPPNGVPHIPPTQAPEATPCKLPPLPTSTHRQNEEMDGDNAPLDREPRPPARAATPTPPSAIDNGVKRCKAIAASGQRCRVEGRWLSGYCKAHDPARRDEVREEARRGRENAMRARLRKRGAIPEAEVAEYMERIRAVTGRPESLAEALDWIAEALLRGTVSPAVGRQLRIAAGRRQRILASYSHPRIRHRRYPATVPPGAPEPDLAPLGPSASPDAPQGNLRANDETPPFAIPDAPAFEIPDPPSGPASGQI